MGYCQTKVALAFFLLAAVVRGALPPDVYEDWKKSAEEYVSLKVLKVQGINPKKIPCRIVNYKARARIQKVIRDSSGSDLKVGDVVTLKTYYHKLGSGDCGPWAGPSSPPLLAKGWHGKAYLNSTAVAGTFDIAAGGESFDENAKPKNAGGCLKVVKKKCTCKDQLTTKKRAAAARRCAKKKAGNLCDLNRRATKRVQTRFAKFCT